MGHLNWGPTYWQKKKKKKENTFISLDPVLGSKRNKRQAYQLYTHGPQLVPHLDRLIEVLPSNVRAQEPTRKGIPSPVRIHDQLAQDRRHPVLLDRPSRPVDENGRLRALGDHDHARAGGVRLAISRDLFRDVGNVGRVGFEDGFGVCLGFGFVPDDDVGVGEDLFQLGVEELEDEGCGEVEDKGLYACVRVLQCDVLCEMRGRRVGMR